jgi:hypothetical protein
MKSRIFLIVLFFQAMSQVFAVTNDKDKQISSLYSSKWALEENKGQITGPDASSVKYVFKNDYVKVFVKNNGLAYQFTNMIYPKGFEHMTPSSTEAQKTRFYKQVKEIELQTYRMDLNLIGANLSSPIVSEGMSEDFIDYYTHDALNVRSFSKVIFTDIYPHIDWVLYCNENSLKYDFIVHPGGDPSAIKMEAKDAEGIDLGNDGSLILKSRMGFIEEKKPISFQGMIPVSSAFILKDNIVRFDIGNYDKNQDLTIDPTIRWSTYYGGSLYDQVLDVFVRKTGFNAGNTFVCGYTASPNAIAQGGFQSTKSGGLYDAFLVAQNRSGTRIQATYYGGNGDDFAKTILADDVNGLFYLAGSTNSTDSARIVTANGFRRKPLGANDGFLVRFSGAGGRQWATYYGGTGDDEFNDMIVRTSGNILLVGATASDTGISQSGFQNTRAGAKDAFYTEFTFNFAGVGSRLRASYIGATGDDAANSVAIDIFNNAFIAGSTTSSSGITLAPGANLAYLGGTSDAFLLKLSATGVRQWATYAGGAGNDVGTGVSLDTFQNAYLVGSTNSTTGFVTNSSQLTYGGGASDGFIARYSTTGARKQACYFGGSGDDYINSAVNIPIGDLFFTGHSTSTSGIASNGFQNTNGGLADVIVVKMDTALAIDWGTYLGGSQVDQATCIDRDGDGVLLVGGVTSSTTGMALGGHQNTYGGGLSDAFVTRICDSCVTPTITISKAIGDTFCADVNVSFTSTIVGGGIGPQYRWLLNNRFVSFSSVATTRFNPGDSIRCLLISNASNRTVDSVWSNVIKPTVYGYMTPSSPFVSTFLCALDSIKYPFRNQYFKWVGPTNFFTLRDTAKNAINGCDSIIVLNLQRNNGRVINSNFQGCVGKPYVWRGKTFLVAGNYADTVKSNIGCDTIFRLFYTTPYAAVTNAIAITTCKNKPYFFDGKNLTSSGFYRDTLISFRGCDSVVILNLTVNDTSSRTLKVDICAGQSYTLGSNVLTTSGFYHDTLVNSKNCDSFVYLTLEVHPVGFGFTDTLICSTSSIIFNGQTISTPGLYLDTLQTVFGCDSFVTWRVGYKYSSNFQFYQTICTNNPIMFQGKLVDTAGIYTDTLTNSIGCDSFLSMIVTSYVPSASTRQVTICPNTSYKLYGKTYSDTGTYRDTIFNDAGCDSLITLKIDMHPSNTVNVIPLGDTLRTSLGFVRYQWYRGAVAIPWDTTFRSIPRVKGVYSVVVTDQNNCKFASNKVSYGSTSIQSSVDGRILIYPVPADKVLTIELGNLSNEKIEILAMDIHGRLLQLPIIAESKQIYKMNIETLASGAYLLKVNIGEQVHYSKFSKD